MKNKILEIFKKHGFDEYNCGFFKGEDIEKIAEEISGIIGTCCDVCNSDSEVESYCKKCIEERFI